jgi:hypothetical protein
MNNIQRRLDKIENLLDINREIVNVIVRLSYEAGSAPQIPESCEDWLIYKKADEEAQKSGFGVVFVADPFREYEVRNNLPEGLISMDERRGEIPFSELLKEAQISLC